MARLWPLVDGDHRAALYWIDDDDALACFLEIEATLRLQIEDGCQPAEIIEGAADYLEVRLAMARAYCKFNGLAFPDVYKAIRDAKYLGDNVVENGD
jgi:hypothetical protein